MSEELPLTREKLHKCRLNLIKYISKKHGIFQDINSFETLDDGGMGSFSINSKNKKPSKEVIMAEFKYTDSDMIDVIITVYGTEINTISSVDFWKLNFDALKSFPDPIDLKPYQQSDESP